MAQMVETEDVRKGDVVSFAAMIGEFTVVRAGRPGIAARRFEVSELGFEEKSFGVRIPMSEGVIVRLRDGEQFGNQDVLHARTMRWS
jgi:hypothetical protein